MGSGEIGLPTLRWLADSSVADLVGVVTQPDKPAGRSQTLSPPASKKTGGHARSADPSTGEVTAVRGTGPNRGAFAGSDRGHGLRPDPAEKTSGNADSGLSQLACVHFAQAPGCGADPGLDPGRRSIHGFNRDVHGRRPGHRRHPADQLRSPFGGGRPADRCTIDWRPSDRSARFGV